MSSSVNRAERDRWDTRVTAGGDQIELNTRRGDDEIRVSREQDGRYRVRINGVDDKYFTEEEMGRLQINGGKGRDRLLLDPSAKGVRLRTKNIEEVQLLEDNFERDPSRTTQPRRGLDGAGPWANQAPADWSQLLQGLLGSFGQNGSQGWPQGGWPSTTWPGNLNPFGSMMWPDHAWVQGFNTGHWAAWQSLGPQGWFR
jgi:hypothetical protein